ncbi:RAD50-interacting protein 1 isoform X2 [Hyalella azteca]|uniref:RAD50-interacting protein 1 isoform X2 n=1 Tax=Hyalella azteca TaxID=294128 RepID=A0A979FGB6_HYAAZ|nr:RAD50-interacting protein 1 isoform X2 [Hyalella azteca]
MASPSLNLGVVGAEVAKQAKKEAVTQINLLLGKDAKKLSSISEVVQLFSNTKVDMEKKLEFVSNAAPDHISTAVLEAEQQLSKSEELCNEAEEILKDVSIQKEKVSGLLGSVEGELELMLQMDAVHCYQAWVKSIQEISSDMTGMMSGGSDDGSALLSRYSELQDILLHVSGRTACSNLERFMLDTLTYWHNRLVQTYSQEFDEVLQSLKYPFISTNTTVLQADPDPGQIKKLQELTSHLLQLNEKPLTLVSKQDVNFDQKRGSPLWKDTLDPAKNSTNLSLSSNSESLSTNDSMFSATSQSPSKSPSKDDQPALVADFEPLLAPLKLLVKPLEVRFAYHFSGNKKTNSVAHPEWCLTRVLSWISSHSFFLNRYIQPVLDEHKLNHVKAQTELSRALVKLTVQKLAADLSTIMTDEDLFCHSLQEVLSFEQELRLSCGYPASQPSVLLVLTQPQVLKHWVSLERKFAVAVMDELVGSPEAWCCLEEGDGWSACGEQLITLLLAVTDRYKALPQPGHRLQFLEVQLELLDEYRVRCVQVSRELQAEPVTSHYPSILSTLHTLISTLEEWGDMPFFLELGVYRAQQRELDLAMEHGSAPSVPLTTVAEAAACSVFDDCVLLYKHVQDEMLATLVQHLMTLLRARFMPYRRDKWFIEPNKSGSSIRCSDVSASFCPLLEVLARQLHSLRRVLAPELFTELWHRLTDLLDKFLFEELVLQNHFSDVGCAQLQFDMTKALFPMFIEFTSKPEYHFPMVKESLTLLTLPLAPALLLRDTLRQTLLSSTGQAGRSAADVPSVVTPEAALTDHGISRISPEDALIILNARNSISTL